MTVLKLAGFTGEVPRLVPRLLPESASQGAMNVRLDTGGLDPYRQPRFIKRIEDIAPGNVKTIYRHDGDWMAWDKQVYAAPGPVAADRLYVFGDGAPKMVVAGVTYPLAVSMPSAALTATVSGTGTGDPYDRVYAYTFVTDFGEESEPSPLSAAVVWKSGQTVTLSGFAAAPSGRGITRQRIYRSQTSLTGTDLYFIAERAAASSDFADNIPLAEQNEPIPSLEWNAPPDNLTGLIALPNGMMAAFRDKEVWFCEPWRPHAWPEKYVLTLDCKVVGLGAYGTTLVVATDAQPYIIAGASPDAMVQEKTELNLPCINPRGIVDLGYAIAYPSHDGLVVVSSSGPRVITDQLMTRDGWIKTSPGQFVAGQFYGRYFASYAYLDPKGVEQAGSFIIDLTGADAFLQRSQRKADACWYDVSAGALFLCVGQDIYEWDSLLSENEILSWKSKQFVIPKPTNFGAILIEGTLLMTPEEEAAVEQAEQEAADRNEEVFNDEALSWSLGALPINSHTINGDDFTRLTAPRFVSVAIFADGRRVATVGAMNKVMRLPAGFLAQLWEVEVSTNASITQITMAGTASELAGA